MVTIDSIHKAKLYVTIIPQWTSPHQSKSSSFPRWTDQNNKKYYQ